MRANFLRFLGISAVVFFREFWTEKGVKRKTVVFDTTVF